MSKSLPDWSYKGGISRNLIKNAYSIHLALIGLAVLLLAPLFILEKNSYFFPGKTVIHPLTINFSHPTGVYPQAITLRLTTAHPDAQIFFTTNASLSLPDGAAMYTRPLHFPADPANVAFVRAWTVLPGGETGPVANATYFMGIEASTPMISLLTDPVGLYDQEKGIITNPLEHGREWERPATIMYVDENGRFGFQTDVGLRIHGFISRNFDKKSFRLHFRNEYGLPRLHFPVFPNSDVNEFKRLVLHAGGQEFPQHSANGTLLRTQLVTNLAENADVYTTQSRPVILFINGQLWGIYILRERINDHFLNSHFGIEPSPSDGEYWNHLNQYVQTHDLADPVNYAYVQTQVDTSNLIDYTLMQMVIANSDWPQNNITQFRGHSAAGRWQYIFWDVDQSFGLVPGDNYEYHMVNHVLNDTPWYLFSILLDNPEFLNRSVSRMADLLNTTFRPENVIAEIDKLAAELEPNIDFETSRWPGSGDWQASVEDLREFARRRPEIMRRHMVEGFDLAGTAVFTFNPASSGGTVTVNEYPLPEAPWQGVYFTGTTVQVTAVPHSGYQFTGWEPKSLSQTAVINIPVTTSDQTITPLFERTRDNR